jgi:hypothetical protein
MRNDVILEEQNGKLISAYMQSRTTTHIEDTKVNIWT